jgi:hypothetical protein
VLDTGCPAAEFATLGQGRVVFYDEDSHDAAKVNE